MSADRTREDRVELTDTAVTPAMAVTLVVLALLPLLLVTGARFARDADGAGGRELVAPWLSVGAELRRERSDGPLSLVRVLQRRIADYEARLEETSPWLAVAQPTVQGVLTRWGGVGNEEVVVGRDGWLHYRPGVELLTGPGFLAPDVLERRRLAGAAWEPEIVPDPRPAILGLAADLARRDVALVFLPVPPKTAILPTTLGAADVADGRPANPSTAALLAELAAAGVQVVDPADLLADLARRGPPPYLRTDSHWSPAAVDAVAAHLARRLVELGVMLGAESTGSRPTTVRGTGDLARLLRLPAWAALAPETVTLPAGPVPQPAAAPVLLLGDSFSNVYARADLGWGTGAGLGDRLAHHLGRPVDVVALNDGGATGSRRELARRLAAGDDVLAGKRAVVWQVAARELARGDWRPVTLPAAASAPAATAAPDGPVTVTGTVAAVAATPAPGTTPYRDLLVAVHLVDIEVTAPPGDGDGKAFAEQGLVMYTWGLRDGERAAGAGLAAGRRIRARLVPWRDVAGELESLERRELNDDDLLLLEPWFSDALEADDAS